MFPRSPKPAGASLGNRRRASCARPLGWSSNAKVLHALWWSPALSYPTTRASSSAALWPTRAVRCRLITRIAPSSACLAAGPAAAADRSRQSWICSNQSCGLVQDLGRAFPDHPQRNKGDDSEPDPGNPEMTVEQPRDKGRGDTHQRDRKDEPKCQQLEMVACNAG